MKQWFKNFRLTLLWGFLIFVLFLTPAQYFPAIPDIYSLFQPDKIIHLFLFGVFTWLILHSILKQYGVRFLRYHGTLIALTTGIFAGATTEILQYSLDINRSGNIYDFIANLAGCFLGLIVFNWLLRKKMKETGTN